METLVRVFRQTQSREQARRFFCSRILNPGFQAFLQIHLPIRGRDEWEFPRQPLAIKKTRYLTGLIRLRQSQPRQLQASGRFHHRNAPANLLPSPAKLRADLCIGARLSNLLLERALEPIDRSDDLGQGTHANNSAKRWSTPGSRCCFATVPMS